jgi:hypothetical protein
MTKISTVLLAFIATVFVNLTCTPQAHAQRVFVSGSGSDSNPCTYTSPCRTFQQAYNTAPANGEIDVLDPAGYGPLTITKGISIQAHGFGGITQSNNANAITIAVTTGAPVTLNGLLLDGAGGGNLGINITSAGSLQILNCVIRHFSYGVDFDPTNTPTSLLIQDTIASDNSTAGIAIGPPASTTPVVLSRVTANNNGGYGVEITGGYVMIRESVLSNNGYVGVLADNPVTQAFLAKSVISGNGSNGGGGAGGVNVFTAGSILTYGNNDINGNSTDVVGSLTPVSTD